MLLMITSQLLAGLATPTYAAIPTADISRNGLIRTGNALLSIVDEKEQSSQLSLCTNDRGSHLFSNSCNDLVVSLRKKMNMMALESDLQIQNEKVNTPSNPQSSDRLAHLEKINLLSIQAEDIIRAAQNANPGEFKGDVTDILSSVAKVKLSYLSWLKAIGK